MKRSLIAVALAVLATAAVAEPTLQMADESRFLNAPEATSYVADTAVQVRSEQDFVWNP